MLFRISLIVILSQVLAFGFIGAKSLGGIDFDSAYNTKAGDKVLATIGGKNITVREFLTSYEFGPSFTKREKDSKSKYLNYMINEKLLALYGYKSGIDTTGEVNHLLSAIKGDLCSDEMFMDEIFNKIKIKKSELDSALVSKSIQYQIRWIYAPDKSSLKFYEAKLAHGIKFDSLYSYQLKKDSVHSDLRSMKVDRFDLWNKNPLFANVIDTLKVNEISKPVKGKDGYYIVKIDDEWKNEILTETQKNKQLHDAKLVLKRNKSDVISDQYVHSLMISRNPVIQGNAFDILRSYMGNYSLPKEKYYNWKLDKRLQKELDSLKSNSYGNLTLVKLNNENISIDDFIYWYRLREEYLKFNEDTFNSYSASLEKMIWQMVRDKLLVQKSYAEGYQNKPVIRQQLSWWKDKIVYAIVRDKIANSVGLDIESPTSLKSKNQPKQQQLLSKVFHKVLELKKQYKINIDNSLLNKIEVQDENDPKAVDYYIVKKGGTFPHPAYPSIDFSWQSWE